MEYLQSLWQNLPGVRPMDIVDIVIVAFLIYKLVPVFTSTGTARIAGIVVAILVITWITGELGLNTLNFILDQMLAVGLIAIVVLFQPELRRMVDHMSNIKIKEFLGIRNKSEQNMIPVIAQVARACEVMSKERVGALIVFSRDNRLDEYFRTGTMIDGQVSEQLIRNIFFPKAALHDGAMIIRDSRVVAAGCVLPLSDSNRISLDLGTRHRAALGMSEVTDAVVIVVSEETGAISVALGGILKRYLTPDTLERLLRNELCPEEKPEKENFVAKIKGKLLKEKDKEETADEADNEE